MNALEQYRLRAGLTVVALAEASGVSYHTIRRAEEGSRRLTDESLINLARALKIDPVDLRCELDADPKAAA